MKGCIKSNYQSILDSIPEENIIYVTVYLRPEIYLNSKVVLRSAAYDKIKNSYPDVDPYRRINGPLSDYGEELEPPIQEQLDNFVDDCDWLIDNYGFTILKKTASNDSKKSEYIVVFGMKDEPCGATVFDLRISDHPLDAKFPEELKDEVLDLLKMNNVLNESATKAGINFRVEKVTIGQVLDDSWIEAFDRLGDTLDNMQKRVRN